MPKIGLGISVIKAARERIAYTFDNFEKIYISFSGGKDSTVMLHLVMDEAIRRGRKIGVLFIDLEAQYNLTIEHVEKCYEMYKDHIEPYWCCLPLHLRNAVSVYETHWICWDREKILSWVRDIPANTIHDEKKFPFFRKGMEFEEFVVEFGQWYAQGKQCACFVGIRSDESLNRFRTISNTTKERLEDKKWTSLVVDKVYNVYPVYDWRTEDIWTYHGRNPEKPYNQLYDMMYKAGLKISQMRICQPYGDDQRKGLWLFHLIEPETWGRIVARVNGANGGSLYVQESGNITGYRKISKPDGHTWESFARLLIASMPPITREHYWNKVLDFRNWWMRRGYGKGIPDEACHWLEASQKVPSWRRVCKSLLRNDYWFRGLGSVQPISSPYGKYLKYKRKYEGIYQ